MSMTKEQANLVKLLAKQGVPMRRTNKGHWLVKCPNGDTVTIGGGTRRGTKNALARLRRGGIKI